MAFSSRPLREMGDCLCDGRSLCWGGASRSGQGCTQPSRRPGLCWHSAVSQPWLEIGFVPSCPRNGTALSGLLGTSQVNRETPRTRASCPCVISTFATLRLGARGHRSPGLPGEVLEPASQRGNSARVPTVPGSGLGFRPQPCPKYS